MEHLPLDNEEQDIESFNKVVHLKLRGNVEAGSSASMTFTKNKSMCGLTEWCDKKCWHSGLCTMIKTESRRQCSGRASAGSVRGFATPRPTRIQSFTERGSARRYNAYTKGQRVVLTHFWTIHSPGGDFKRDGFCTIKKKSAASTKSVHVSIDKLEFMGVIYPAHSGVVWKSRLAPIHSMSSTCVDFNSSDDEEEDVVLATELD